MTTEESTEVPVNKYTEKQRKYYTKNRDSWNEYQKEYKKRRYAEDPEYRFKVKEYQRELRKKNDLRKKNTQ